MAERRPPRRARLLVLGAGVAQLGLLEAARERDLYVIAADRDPQAPGFALADERAVISSEDEPAIERLARALEPDGLISPGADWPVGIAARVAERLGVTHPISGATAALATTKTRQRDRLAAAGVPQPRTYAAATRAFPFPCVVKAPDRQGQRGLTLVRGPGSCRPRSKRGDDRVAQRRCPDRGARRGPRADGQRRLGDGDFRRSPSRTA